jgi:N-acetylglucosamine malate deacetylase 2
MTPASHAVPLRAAAAPGCAYLHRAGSLPARVRRNPGDPPTRVVTAAPAGAPLLRTTCVLVVTARPGQESADLGGLLHAFRRMGANLALLCLTRGEASPLNSTCERLETIRSWELQVAAGILGVSSLMVADFPDGGLSRSPIWPLTERVLRAIGTHEPDLLLVTDPAAGTLGHARVAQAACLAACLAGLPVVARTRPGIQDSWELDLGAETATARAVQRSAAAAHASQSQASTHVRRRLDLLGRREPLRWLIPPAESGRTANPPSATRDNAADDDVTAWAVTRSWSRRRQGQADAR